jgi:apolipoprotein N-acyltransferase
VASVAGFAARLAGGLASAALLTLAFPPFDQGWLAWVALVPLLLACRGAGPGPALVVGLVAGAAASLGVYSWILEVPVRWYHVLPLALWLGLFTGAWSAGVAVLARSRVPALLAAPSLWVAADWVKAHAGFLAIPWGTLAHTQHRDLALLQTATLAGEYGVTFLVVLANVAVAGTIARGRRGRGAGAAVAGLAAAHLLGWAALAPHTGAPSLRVAAIQPSILLGERATAAGRDESFGRLERLTAEAAVARPALIAWPETAIRDLGHEPALAARIQRLVDGTGIPLVVGASEFTKFSRRDGTDLPPDFRAFDSAHVFRPGRAPDPPHRKTILLPFAEYLPLEGIVRWPAWFAPRTYPSLPGERLREFLLDDGTAFTIRICWEGAFADAIRPSVRAGARLLVQINNANHFGRSAAAPQHLLVTVLRAVENRLPAVVSSNAGPSAIIDPWGRVLAGIPELFAAGAVTAAVPLGDGGTFYTRWGDWFVALASLVALAALGDAVRARSPGAARVDRPAGRH